MPLRYVKRGTSPNERRLTPSAPEAYRALAFAADHGPVLIPGELSARRYAKEPRESLEPRHPGAFARCVEGIVQGLKIIDGKAEPALLTGTPRVRRGGPEGWRYGTEGRVLGGLQARALLVVPAYLDVLEQRGRPALQGLLEEARTEDVLLADDVYAPNPFSLDAPLGPARLLVDLALGKLDPY